MNELTCWKINPPIKTRETSQRNCVLLDQVTELIHSQLKNHLVHCNHKGEEYVARTTGVMD